MIKLVKVFGVLLFLTFSIESIYSYTVTEKWKLVEMYKIDPSCIDSMAISPETARKMVLDMNSISNIDYEMMEKNGDEIISYAQKEKNRSSQFTGKIVNNEIVFDPLTKYLIIDKNESFFYLFTGKLLYVYKNINSKKAKTNKRTIITAITKVFEAKNYTVKYCK